jgi:hypothetical protein
MKIINHFDYPEISRTTHQDGSRFYVCPKTGEHLPSVTTVLSATANKEGLRLWEEFVGKKKADAVREEALLLGTLMHTHLENHVQGIPRPRGNLPIRMLAERMANKIIEKFMPHVDEVWGMEVALYFPHLYAGTTDLVGVFKGEPAIMDYKTAKNIRTRSQFEDYFLQMAAYAIAHNEVYNTDIRKGVVVMVSRDLEYMEFDLSNREYEKAVDDFLLRYDQFLTKSVAA